MKDLIKNYNNFIDKKIDKLINSLRKNSKTYKKNSKKYSKLYHELSKELSYFQMQKLDKLLCISNILSSEELNEFYKTEIYKKT